VTDPGDTVTRLSDSEKPSWGLGGKGGCAWSSRNGDGMDFCGFVWNEWIVQWME
jgi:hypothetical protein